MNEMLAEEFGFDASFSVCGILMQRTMNPVRIQNDCEY